MSKNINTGFLAKLKNMLMKLTDIRTEDGRDIMVDGDIEVGKDVLIAQDGEYVPAPNGEYKTGELVIVVEAGKITEVRQQETTETTEEQAETTETTETAEQEAAEQEQAAEEQEDIDNLRAERDRLKAENEDLKARIAELEQRINMAAVPPAEQELEKTEKSLANKFIENARARQ